MGAVLGIRIVEVPATETQITGGLRVSRHANQPRRRPQVPYATNVAPSPNLGKVVAAVAVVLGSETVEVLLTASLITRGTRASRPAKYCHSSSQPSADGHTRLNSGTPRMVPAWLSL